MRSASKDGSEVEPNPRVSLKSEDPPIMKRRCTSGRDSSSSTAVCKSRKDSVSVRWADASFAGALVSQSVRFKHSMEVRLGHTGGIRYYDSAQRSAGF